VYMISYEGPTMISLGLIPRPLSEISRRGLATRTTLRCPKGIQSVTRSPVNVYTHDW